MIALLFPFAILSVIVGYAALGAHGRPVTPRELLRATRSGRRVGRVLRDWVRLADEPQPDAPAPRSVDTARPAPGVGPPGVPAARAARPR